jgi:hypothetical protein
MAAYRTAFAGEDAPATKPKIRGEPGTFSRLATQYFVSPEFLRLRTRTQYAYRLVIERFLSGPQIGPQLRGLAGHVNDLQGAKGLEGFTTYNLGIALRVAGRLEAAHQELAEVSGLQEFRAKLAQSKLLIVRGVDELEHGRNREALQLFEQLPIKLIAGAVRKADQIQRHRRGQ